MSYVSIDTCDEFHACRGEFILPCIDRQQAELYSILKGGFDGLGLHWSADLSSVTHEVYASSSGETFNCPQEVKQ